MELDSHVKETPTEQAMVVEWRVDRVHRLDAERWLEGDLNYEAEQIAIWWAKKLVRPDPTKYPEAAEYLKARVVRVTVTEELLMEMTPEGMTRYQVSK